MNKVNNASSSALPSFVQSHKGKILTAIALVALATFLVLGHVHVSPFSVLTEKAITIGASCAGAVGAVALAASIFKHVGKRKAVSTFIEDVEAHYKDLLGPWNEKTFDPIKVTELIKKYKPIINKDKYNNTTELVIHFFKMMRVVPCIYQQESYIPKNATANTREVREVVAELDNPGADNNSSATPSSAGEE